MKSKDAVILETQSLTKVYRMGEVSVVALAGVDVEVRRGEFLAIMGPSGSGKSTLLHLLGGLDKPTSGEVLLDGQALSTLSDEQITLLRRRRIGFIFQFYNLIPTLTARENIALPLLIDGVPLQRHEEHVARLLRLVGLEDRAHHRPDQLSGGQQQRVAIARAFVNQPHIVLADEPTGNLDSHAGSAVLELLCQAQEEIGATIIMVTHDPRAASYAERLIFLQDGRIVDELHANGRRIPVKRITRRMTRLES